MNYFKLIILQLIYYYTIIKKYFHYRKNPKFSFYIINYKNKTSEIVLFKNAYKFNTKASCYNMQIYNNINQEDGTENYIWDLDDCNDFIKKYIPIWTFKQLYRFVKLTKRNNKQALYEYSIIVETKKLKLHLKNHNLYKRNCHEKNVG